MFRLFSKKMTENLFSEFFFLQTAFDYLICSFDKVFFISFRRHRYPQLKFKKMFSLWSFFVKFWLWGFKYCQCGTIETQLISCYKRVSRDLTLLEVFPHWIKTCSLVYLAYLTFYIACRGMVLRKSKKKIEFFFENFINSFNSNEAYFSKCLQCFGQYISIKFPKRYFWSVFLKIWLRCRNLWQNGVFIVFCERSEN